MRLTLLTLGIALGAACTPLGARTLVYEFDDGEPIGQLDRDECVVGAGLRIPLGPTQTIAFDIASDQSTANLATCDLAQGLVTQCGVFDPIIPLEIEGTTVTGIGSSPVIIDDPNCSEATLESEWVFELGGEEQTLLDGRVAVTWRLPDTAECDTFESLILEANPGNGRVDGCIVNFEFSATQVAECRVDGTSLFCD